MKKDEITKILRFISIQLSLLIGIVIAFVLMSAVSVKADELEFHSMKATAYCLDGITASGQQTREGICASRPEWIGKTAAIYINDNETIGDFLGYYEIEDTGDTPIRKGYVIDIWMDDYQDCIEFGAPDVYVLIIDGEEDASKQQDNDSQITDSNQSERGDYSIGQNPVLQCGREQADYDI